MHKYLLVDFAISFLQISLQLRWFIEIIFHIHSLIIKYTKENKKEEK